MQWVYYRKDDVLQKSTFETYIMLLTNVTSQFNKGKKNKMQNNFSNRFTAKFSLLNWNYKHFFHVKVAHRKFFKQYFRKDRMFKQIIRKTKSKQEAEHSQEALFCFCWFQTQTPIWFPLIRKRLSTYLGSFGKLH